jgi:hypothetical protein
VVLVPVEAVRQQDGQSHVLVPNTQDSDAPPVERKLDIGLSDGQNMEVRAGLAEGETVLIPQLALGKAGKSSSPRLTSPFGGRR